MVKQGNLRQMTYRASGGWLFPVLGVLCTRYWCTIHRLLAYCSALSYSLWIIAHSWCTFRPFPSTLHSPSLHHFLFQRAPCVRWTLLMARPLGNTSSSPAQLFRSPSWAELCPGRPSRGRELDWPSGGDSLLRAPPPSPVQRDGHAKTAEPGDPIRRLTNDRSGSTPWWRLSLTSA